jgi:hypothetical protein
MENVNPIWIIIHLAALCAAYGSVVIVDLIGLLWLGKQIERERMLAITAWAQPIIWAGIIVMMISGAMLGPDLSRPLTKVKMTLIILLAINGLNLDALRKRTKGLTGQSFWDAPTSYKAWSVFSIVLSQALWISIVVVAALNSAD